MNARQSLEAIQKGLETAIAQRDPQYGCVYDANPDVDMLTFVQGQIEATKSMQPAEAGEVYKALHRILDNYLTVQKNYEGLPSNPAPLGFSDYTDPYQDGSLGPMGGGPEMTEQDPLAGAYNGGASQVSENGYPKGGNLDGAAFKPENGSKIDPSKGTGAMNFQMQKGVTQVVVEDENGVYLEDPSWAEDTDLSAAAERYTKDQLIAAGKTGVLPTNVNAPQQTSRPAEQLRKEHADALAASREIDKLPDHPSNKARALTREQRADREARANALRGAAYRGMRGVTGGIVGS